MRFKAKKNNAGTGWDVIDTKTERLVVWVYDQMHGYHRPEVDKERANLFADALNGKFQDEIAILKSAILQTLDDNAHLADGENCTLFTLKLALRELGCPWDGDKKTS
jgi:hypothetical protein